MPVERLDRSQIAGLSGADVDSFIESDFKIRSGLCPNGCGLLSIVDDGDGLGPAQVCDKCNYFTNVMPEKDTSQ